MSEPIFTDCIIDDEMFSEALRIVDGDKGKIEAVLNTKKAWAAMSFLDNEGRTWTTPDEGKTWQREDDS